MNLHSQSRPPQHEEAETDSREASGPRLIPAPEAGYHNPFDVTWKERLVVLGVVFGTITALIIAGLRYSPDATKQLFALVPASFFGIGKFLPCVTLGGDWVSAILPGDSDKVLWSSYELGAVIGIMDSCTVLLIVYSLEPLYGVWLIGPFLEKTQAKTRIVLDAFPWMRSFAIFAVVLFVLFPVSGTGAIGGSFLGAFLGMHRVRLIFAVVFGGFLGGMTMAFLTERFGETIRRFNNNPWFIVSLVVVIVALLYAMNRSYKKALARAKTREN